MLEANRDKLACPECYGDLFVSEVRRKDNDSVREGTITCKSCDSNYRIDKFIARFVNDESYTEGFGFQWTKHCQTQFDSYTGLNLSKERFFNETGWASNLNGEIILEVGCGSGRFTEIAASTNAFVVSLDCSRAVEANYSMNGARKNVLIVQGDVYKMPLRKNYFDKIFCFGMLQHTPNVEKAFMSLCGFLKPGGELVIDIYKRTILATLLSTKYYIRPFTSRINPTRLYKLMKNYVNMMWPLVMLISKIPRVGTAINSRLLVSECSKYGVKGRLLREMAYLDTFDMLSPKYDKPRSLRQVEGWFDEAGLETLDLRYGLNGIVAKGRVTGP